MICDLLLCPSAPDTCDLSHLQSSQLEIHVGGKLSNDFMTIWSIITIFIYLLTYLLIYFSITLLVM